MQNSNNGSYDIAPEHQENYNKLVADYLAEEEKLEILNKLPESDAEYIKQIGITLTIGSRELRAALMDRSFQVIYCNVLKAKNENSITEELRNIFHESIKKAKLWLEININELKMEILKDQYQQYFNLITKNPEKAKILLQNKLKNCSSQVKDAYEFSSNELKYLDKSPNFIAPNLRLFDRSKEDKSFLEKIAFLYYKPETLLFSYFKLSHEWQSFPYKWKAKHLPVAFVKDLMSLRKEGIDITTFMTEKYTRNDFQEIRGFLDSHYLQPPVTQIISERSEFIQEVIQCYSNKSFAGSSCLALTLIEGMLWDFSLLVQDTDGGIYEQSSSEKIISNGGIIVKNPTIGVLLKNTKFGNAIDENFINYFCDELYAERNPILHGRDYSKLTQEDAGKKIATIEFILATIASYTKTKFRSSFEKDM